MDLLVAAETGLHWRGLLLVPAQHTLNNMHGFNLDLKADRRRARGAGCKHKLELFDECVVCLGCT